MSKARAATLDDDSLFTATPQPVPGLGQRGQSAAPSTLPEAPPPLKSVPSSAYVDLNFKVPSWEKRRVKDLAYKLDCKHVDVLRRALDALEREISQAKPAP
jgi:hypothetical protein